ncbi:DUF3820 family protein [Oceaniserpentilla sp. 4NH20-0058]|uniref:DUF3820 family protein n=1 Tax=Oceaniserpentilla sp. 4NH20-0058 TaxID=3127660 RepID=UPI0031076851
MFDQKDLLALANMPMPFGKYQGKVLMDLPEEYLLWFQHKGWPAGRLGMLLGLCLEIKINGLEPILNPLRGKHYVVNE